MASKMIANGNVALCSACNKLNAAALDCKCTMAMRDEKTSPRHEYDVAELVAERDAARVEAERLRVYCASTRADYVLLRADYMHVVDAIAASTDGAGHAATLVYKLRRERDEAIALLYRATEALLGKPGTPPVDEIDAFLADRWRCAWAVVGEAVVTDEKMLRANESRREMHRRAQALARRVAGLRRIRSGAADSNQRSPARRGAQAAGARLQVRRRGSRVDAGNDEACARAQRGPRLARGEQGEK